MNLEVIELGLGIWTRARVEAREKTPFVLPDQHGMSSESNKEICLSLISLTN